jgi:putative nucleotidyltransferase with HDIG domain
MSSASVSGGRRAPRTERWLPHALIATALVVVAPALAVWEIVPRGDAAMLAISVPLGMALSLLAAGAGGAIWKRTPGSRDLVFADLMLWGWLRRLRAERRLVRAEALLGGDAEAPSVEALTDLSALLEARDSYTYGHSQRVSRHAEGIAAAMGLPAAEVAKVRTAAALHDVGKLHTPRAILNKPGRLTDEEFAVIRRHPGEGAALAGDLADPAITAIIRHHHERLDGGGYPDGLAGEAIPLGARIIAVADTFDAMTSTRAYRRAASHKRALDVLAREAGTQLDAKVVAGFLGYYRGRRTVAWSAFVTAAPQRFLSWLGSLSPALGTGAAALALGLGSAQPAPVPSQLAAVPPLAAAREAKAPARVSARARPRPAQRTVAAGRVRRVTPRVVGHTRPDRTRARARAHRDPAPVAPAPAAASPVPSSSGGGVAPANPPRPTVGPAPTPTPRPALPPVALPNAVPVEVALPDVGPGGVGPTHVEVAGVNIDLPAVELPHLHVAPLGP